jgi:hypothetical protein
MDDRKASISPHDPDERVGADAAPIVPAREDLFVVYCGNAQRVSEGFAIAL